MSKLKKPKNRNVKVTAAKLQAVVDRAAAPQTAAPPSASPRAMGIAQMVMRIATQKKNPKMAVTPLDSIASAIDGVLRFDTAMAESNGIQKGQEEEKQKIERGVLTGLAARVQYQIENTIIKAETFTISAADALILAGFLERHGFHGYKRPAKDADTKMRWEVRYAQDGAMHASQERA